MEPPLRVFLRALGSVIGLVLALVIADLQWIAFAAAPALFVVLFAQIWPDPETPDAHE